MTSSEADDAIALADELEEQGDLVAATGVLVRAVERMPEVGLLRAR